MRKLTLTFLGGLTAFVLAAPAVASPVVPIVMRDPGCHWFMVGAKYSTRYVSHGPVTIRNLDEAALRFAGPTGTRLEKVGQTLRFTKGTYRITMVHQAKDDNVLTLVVK
jgi:hypothetical protein